VRVAPLKERFALGALRLRSVPLEREAFLPQAQRSSSETLIKRSAPSAAVSELAKIFLTPRASNLRPNAQA